MVENVSNTEKHQQWCSFTRGCIELFIFFFFFFFFFFVPRKFFRQLNKHIHESFTEIFLFQVRSKLEMCQYDTDAPAQGHPQPHAGILQKLKLKKGTNQSFLEGKHLLKEKKGHNSHNNGLILPYLELDLYFMIIYLCVKFEINTLMFSKDIKLKLFFNVEKGL